MVELMQTAEMIIPLAGAAGAASWLGTVIANKTNLSNLKNRLDEVIVELKQLNDRQHQHDKDIEILKIRNLGNKP